MCEFRSCRRYYETFKGLNFENLAFPLKKLFYKAQATTVILGSPVITRVCCFSVPFSKQNSFSKRQKEENGPCKDFNYFSKNMRSMRTWNSIMQIVLCYDQRLRFWQSSVLSKNLVFLCFRYISKLLPVWFHEFFYLAELFSKTKLLLHLTKKGRSW